MATKNNGLRFVFMLFLFCALIQAISVVLLLVFGAVPVIMYIHKGFGLLLLILAVVHVYHFRYAVKSLFVNKG